MHFAGVPCCPLLHAPDMPQGVRPVLGSVVEPSPMQPANLLLAHFHVPKVQGLGKVEICPVRTQRLRWPRSQVAGSSR
jgi:hypothetical protein